jgi:uncharacterized membrane protein
MKSNHMASNLFQAIASRPLLISSILVAMAVFYLTPSTLAEHLSNRFIISWNIASLFYLGLSLEMMVNSSLQKMQQRAIDQKVGRHVLLFLVIIVSIICIASTISSLSIAKELQGRLKWEHMGLAGFTVFTSWTFTQIMFAQHYAHEYYFEKIHGRSPGLQFPGTPEPDYFDFLYFSCIIGTAEQTADVSFTTSSLRRVGLSQSILSFFFNTVLIALTINIGSNLI